MQKGTTLLGATLQFKSTFQRNSTPNGLNQGGWDVIYKGDSHSNYIFCKFIQRLGGVMKYILITLLSFTFATQITTREVEIEVPISIETTSYGFLFSGNINLFDYIDKYNLL